VYQKIYYSIDISHLSSHNLASNHLFSLSLAVPVHGKYRIRHIYIHDVWKEVPPLIDILVGILLKKLN